MRQVKFRYWNGSKILNQEAIINHLNKYIARNDKHLMQFTGLFDKQGVEIYEGDIVTTPYRNTNGYICYSAPNFGLKDKIGICVDFTWEDFNEFEVIGNIYEHSHLLDNN